MSLAIILATRGRQQILRETIERTVANIELDSTRLIIAADCDDHETCDALSSTWFDAIPQAVPCIWPREDSLGAKYNRALRVDASAEAYLAMVDYAPHVMPGFDRILLERIRMFPDCIGVVYNRLANASFPGINCVSRALCDEMGFLYPPYFPYWFIDHWLDDVARMIDRVAFADVEIDTARRPGTMELREPAFWGTYFDLLRLERRRCARRIVQSECFQEVDWRKEILLSHYPLIEFRSEWVNSHLRTGDPYLAQQERVAGPADERYRRLKEQAIKRLPSLIAEVEADNATREVNNRIVRAAA